MFTRISAIFLLLTLSCAAQTLTRHPLQLPNDDLPKDAPVTRSTPASQLAACRVRADSGDPDAAFQLGIFYLIGQGVAQNAATAEQYFQKSPLTPARKCFVAETYMETAVPGRIDAAMRWVTAANSACTYWMQAHWYGGNQLGPNPQKEIEFLRKGLALPHNQYRLASQRRLGELLLTGTAIEAKQSDKVAWIGEAARVRLGVADYSVAQLYAQHPEQSDDSALAPEAGFDWTRKAARYGIPAALAELGQAAMTRQASDLTFEDGMAFYTLGLRQDPLSDPTLETEISQLEPAQREELQNAVAEWERIAQETGAYYDKRDPLRLSPPISEAELAGLAKPTNPDAELRLAYVFESKGQFARAEALYREVWQNGSAHLLFGLAETAAKSEKWPWTRELYLRAANAGSRTACAALAHIDGEGLAGKKDPLSAYLWILRAETRDAQQLAARQKAVSSTDLQTVQLTQALWIVQHKEFWPRDAKAAQAILDTQQQKEMQVQNFQPFPQKPPVPTEELRTKADAGDAESAYDLAIRFLFDRDSSSKVDDIEHYASLGAKTPEQKARIASGYEQTQAVDEAVRRQYAEKWLLAVGGSQGFYLLAKLYNGKSDGAVATDDERKAVAYWQQSVAAPIGLDERWARLSRMELGYRVIKGWSSGNRSNDANWAHELAMEFLCKEFYEVAGEYSYGHELEHNPQTYDLLVERAAIYNSDNAQSQIAIAIMKGEWKHQDDIDAYAWMKLHVVKQDSGDNKQVDLAEQNPDLKQKIESRYNQLLKTRAESGAFYPQDDPLRASTVSDLEPRAAQLDPEAQFRLGTLLEQQATPESLARAIDLYRTLWATSGRELRLTWGRDLMAGTPEVPRNDIGAEKWLWDAANAGSHEACRDLAVIYQQGRGVKADPVAAETWRRLADPTAKPTQDLTSQQRDDFEHRISDWLSKHPNW